MPVHLFVSTLEYFFLKNEHTQIIYTNSKNYTKYDLLEYKFKNKTNICNTIFVDILKNCITREKL